DGPREERKRERRERLQRRRRRVARRKEQLREHEHGRGAVDVEIEELDGRADEACGKDSAFRHVLHAHTAALIGAGCATAARRAYMASARGCASFALSRCAGKGRG